MSSLPYEYFSAFEKTIMRYLLFLVHVQQSITLPAADKIKVFALAKEISNSIYSNVQRHLSNSGVKT